MFWILKSTGTAIMNNLITSVIMFGLLTDHGAAFFFLFFYAGVERAFREARRWNSRAENLQRIRSCSRVHYVPVYGVYGAVSSLSLSSFYSRARYWICASSERTDDIAFQYRFIWLMFIGFAGISLTACCRPLSVGERQSAPYRRPSLVVAHLRLRLFKYFIRNLAEINRIWGLRAKALARAASALPGVAFRWKMQANFVIIKNMGNVLNID